MKLAILMVVMFVENQPIGGKFFILDDLATCEAKAAEMRVNAKENDVDAWVRCVEIDRGKTSLPFGPAPRGGNA